MLADLRYGLRGIRANPGFCFLAILTLALGIGAGTTMFSVIKNVLLSPFPYKNPEQIAAFAIHDLDSSRPGGRTFMKAAEYLEFQQQNHVFSEDTGGGNEDVLWTTGVGTEQFDGAYVTPNTFVFLGVAAQIGRGLLPEDAKPGAPPVFVMSYKLWRTRFNLFEIVGVVGDMKNSGIQEPIQPEIWCRTLSPGCSSAVCWCARRVSRARC
ncbi:MAG: ABC transporter permease [Candidatus Solibacter sp.]